MESRKEKKEREKGKKRIGKKETKEEKWKSQGKREIDIKRYGREYNGRLEASLQAATAIKENERIGIHPASY